MLPADTPAILATEHYVESHCVQLRRDVSVMAPTGVWKITLAGPRSCTFDLCYAPTVAQSLMFSEPLKPFGEDDWLDFELYLPPLIPDGVASGVATFSALPELEWDN